jgi:hypothetical protein
MWQIVLPGGAAADHDRAAGGAADLAHRRVVPRCDGRLRARRRHDDRLALRRLARRVRRHRGDRVVGYCLVKGMALLRRRLLLWHQEALEPSTA